MYPWGLFSMDPALAGAAGVGRPFGFSVSLEGFKPDQYEQCVPFALWIVFDLAVIALGAGAFFTGFLTYIVGRKELKSIINTAVVIGFICYSGAMAMLGIDIGQPIRGWFIFWHANIHSMLVEVSFCITCYLIVLTIEFVPLILENRQIKKVKELKLVGHNLHEIMAVFCGNRYVSVIFHQGSLGGMFGVMYARPFAARERLLYLAMDFFPLCTLRYRLWSLLYHPLHQVD